jgi:hypothetical protein
LTGHGILCYELVVNIEGYEKVEIAVFESDQIAIAIPGEFVNTLVPGGKSWS